MHLRLVASLPAPLTPLPAGAGSAGGSKPAAHSQQASGGGSRRAYFGPQQGWLDVPLVDRETLGQQSEESGGRGRAGPLIVEDYDATTLVPPGWRAALDGDGSILLEESRSRRGRRGAGESQEEGEWEGR